MTALLYKRNLRHTFAIKKNTTEEEIDNYFGKTVLQNKIDGLIKPSAISINGLYEIHYDITGMQSMETIFQTKEIGYEEIQKLFFCLESLLRETEKYLLDTSHFVFEPEQLYYCFESESWYFLYDFSTDEHTLLPVAEYLIERCDPKDEKATAIAYDFYEKVESNMLSMDVLEGYLEQKQEVEARKQEEKENEPKDNTENDLFDENPEDTTESIKKSFRSKMKEIAGALLALAGLLFAAYKIIGIWFIYTKIEVWLWSIIIILLLVAGAAFLLFAIKEMKLQRNEAVLQSEFEELESFFQDKTEKANDIDSEENETCENETVYIEKADFHKNHSLAEIRKDKEIMHYIESYPYVIGKDKERVHLTVKDRGVSHVHARLLMEQDEVYIEDLCSKNGTYINDFLIEPHEKTILHRGDILILGSSEFVFR